MQLVTILVYVPSSDAAWCFLSVNVVEKTDSTVPLKIIRDRGVPDGVQAIKDTPGHPNGLDMCYI